MPTKQPRLNVVLEPEAYRAIEKLAKKEKISMSLVARDLLREALNLYEDAFWVREAEAREKNIKSTISHKSIWQKAGSA